eukprot:TRINITY_DN21617_c0_g1_i1.p1 TRINITY_DN21617_c0_g1~~TRINITY_DN21617_c0_g1_i1.p1  ORF type:complete len:1003 (+),score=226.82 TRINITY_DN21617_c0_g1_i1:805-3813(+)
MKEMKIVFKDNEVACIQDIDGKPFLVTSLNGEGRSLNALGIRHDSSYMIGNGAEADDDDDFGPGALVPRDGTKKDIPIRYLDVLPDQPYFDFHTPDNGLVPPVVEKPAPSNSSSPMQHITRLASKIFSIPSHDYLVMVTSAAFTLLITYAVWVGQSLKRAFQEETPATQSPVDDKVSDDTDNRQFGSPDQGIVAIGHKIGKEENKVNLDTSEGRKPSLVTYHKAGHTGEREVAVHEESSPESKPVTTFSTEVVTYQKAGITGERSRKSSGEGGLLRTTSGGDDDDKIPSVDVILLVNRNISTSIDALRKWALGVLGSDHLSARVGIVQFSGDVSAGESSAKTSPTGTGTGGKLSGNEDEVTADLEWHSCNTMEGKDDVVKKGVDLAINMFQNNSDADHSKVLIVVSNSVDYISTNSKEESKKQLAANGINVFDVLDGKVAISNQHPHSQNSNLNNLLSIDEMSNNLQINSSPLLLASNSSPLLLASPTKQNPTQSPKSDQSSSSSSSSSDSDSSSSGGKLGNRVFKKPTDDDSDSSSSGSSGSSSSSSSGDGKLGQRVFRKRSTSSAKKATSLFKQQSSGSSSSSSSSNTKLGNRVFKTALGASDFSESTHGGRNWDDTINSSYFRDDVDDTSKRRCDDPCDGGKDVAEVETPPSTYQLNYNELHDIGGGGYGSVWLAENKTDKKHYAVKKIRLRSKDDKDKTMREASMHASFDHPNIARYNFSWEEELSLEETIRAASPGDGTAETITKTLTTLVGNRTCLHSRRHLFIAMKYYAEGSLKDWLNNRDTVSCKENCQLMLQLIEGLLHLHQNEVLHRDMKPSNVLVDRSPKGKMILKICDFGLSVIKRSDWEPLGSVLQEDRHTTGVAGTPLYASPEQQNNGTYGRYSDIYSLGAIFFELFMERPTDSERIVHLQALKAEDRDSAIRMNFKDSWEEEKKLILRMTHPVPAERPTLSEIKRSLKERLRSMSAVQQVSQDVSASDDDGYESDSDSDEIPSRTPK